MIMYSMSGGEKGHRDRDNKEEGCAVGDGTRKELTWRGVGAGGGIF